MILPATLETQCLKSLSSVTSNHSFNILEIRLFKKYIEVVDHQTWAQINFQTQARISYCCRLMGRFLLPELLPLMFQTLKIIKTRFWLFILISRLSFMAYIFFFVTKSKYVDCICVCRNIACTYERWMMSNSCNVPCQAISLGIQNWSRFLIAWWSIIKANWAIQNSQKYLTTPWEYNQDRCAICRVSMPPCHWHPSLRCRFTIKPH